MKAKVIALIKHPPSLAWETMRDRLPEIAPLLGDIESVTPESRQREPDGAWNLVNIWKARPHLPAIIASHIRPDMLAWTERSSWPTDSFECSWKIEPHFFVERIHCSGVTRYEPAMGGRGTRITFDGAIEIETLNFPGVPTAIARMVTTGIEAFVSALIPKNFRKLAEAMAKLLDR